KPVMKVMNQCFRGAAVTVACCLLFVACSKQTSYQGPSNNQSLANAQNRPLQLTQFEQVHGTRYFVAEIVEKQSRSSSSSYSGKGEVRNLVFVDSDSLDSHRLFDANSNLIISHNEYPGHSQPDESQSKNDNIVTQWLVYQVAKTDTNGDGRLDAS